MCLLIIKFPFTPLCLLFLFFFFTYPLNNFGLPKNGATVGFICKTVTKSKSLMGIGPVTGWERSSMKPSHRTTHTMVLGSGMLTTSYFAPLVSKMESGWKSGGKSREKSGGKKLAKTWRKQWRKQL